MRWRRQCGRASGGRDTRSREYRLRGIAYAASGIPVERQEAALPDLKPGAEARVRLAFASKDVARVQLDVVRPTGFSAFTAEWRPVQ